MDEKMTHKTKMTSASHEHRSVNAKICQYGRLGSLRSAHPDLLASTKACSVLAKRGTTPYTLANPTLYLPTLLPNFLSYARNCSSIVRRLSSRM